MFAKLTTIAFALILPTAGSADASNSGTVRGVIVQVSEKPAPSGLISAWVEISIADKAGINPIKMFIPYMTEKQRLPLVGRSCDFNYHIGNIDGAVGRQIKKIQDAWVVDRFVCQSKQP